MKKYTKTASLAVLAALFSTNIGGAHGLDFSDFHTTVPHTGGLGSVPSGLLGSDNGSGGSHDDGCCTDVLSQGIKGRIRADCGDACKPDEWGCNGHFIHNAATNHCPTNRTVLGSVNNLQAFVIPAQVLLSNTTTDIVSNFNSTSNGNRCKTQADKFHVKGKFCANHYECLNNFERDDDCFYENGCVVNKFNEFEGEHPVDCDCNGLSSTDVMDFGPDGCECGDHEQGGKLIEDPVKDVTKRINKEIYKTIGDVLSTILSTAL